MGTSKKRVSKRTAGAVRSARAGRKKPAVRRFSVARKLELLRQYEACGKFSGNNGGLSRADARAVEQVLIEVHGLGKNGTLLNPINSIATTNPLYLQAVQRGYKLLQSIGYK